MNKVLCLIFAVFLSIITLHPGRTDENGGHYDRSTGEYHYHHGYPAHQHENGICPYDNENRVNESQSNRSASVSQGSRPISEAPKKPSVLTVVEIVFSFLIGIYCIVWFIMFFFVAPRIHERRYREWQAKKYQPYLDRIHNKRK